MINTRALGLLERSLDAAALRQKVIANNIANVDTPNFKRSAVRFEEFLLQELNATDRRRIAGYRTDARHIHIGRPASGSARPEVFQVKSTTFNHNNNNVDIEYEMALLAENQLRYNLLIDRTNGYFKSLRTAIDRR